MAYSISTEKFVLNEKTKKLFTIGGYVVEVCTSEYDGDAKLKSTIKITGTKEDQDKTSYYYSIYDGKQIVYKKMYATTPEKILKLLHTLLETKSGNAMAWNLAIRFINESHDGDSNWTNVDENLPLPDQFKNIKPSKKKE